MLRKAHDLIGYSLLAEDGEIGSVSDFYFDDFRWQVRYMIADTGPWLFGREVLIAPVALGQPIWNAKQLPVNLTKQQIEDSPSVEADRPVSRQEEARIREYFQWPAYWAAPGMTGAVGYAGGVGAGVAPAVAAPVRADAADATVDPDVDAEEVAEGDLDSETSQSHTDSTLRSVKEVTGYHIQASDGEIGHVEDFFLDEESWTIRYMLVNTRNWLPGRKVLVAPSWIQRVSWQESKVHVRMTQEEIKKSPEYDPETLIEREYESRVYEYYGIPGYWI